MAPNHMDSSAFCQGRYSSPTSMFVNRLLWGDQKNGDFGVLIRSYDVWHEEAKIENSSHSGYIQFHTEVRYLPSSFLHASLRAKKVAFGSSGRVFGSRYEKNWSMKRLQEGNQSISARAYYPSDSGSLVRGTSKSEGGSGCRYEQRHPAYGNSHRMCVNGTCLVDVENKCACNSSIAPNRFGDYLSKSLNGSRVPGLARRSCWFPGTDQGIRKMVEASNSFWTERRRWQRGGDNRYQGWTEVMATKNIQDLNMADAIFVSLPETIGENGSLCNCTPAQLDTVLSSIKHEGRWEGDFHDLAHSVLPVLFYVETKGMLDDGECAFAWNGTACDDGYKKSFFSQPFNFSDGSCLARPRGCKDVYYYPQDNLTGVCSAFQNLGTHKEEICWHERRLDQFGSTNKARAVKDPWIVRFDFNSRGHFEAESTRRGAVVVLIVVWLGRLVYKKVKVGKASARIAGTPTVDTRKGCNPSSPTSVLDLGVSP